MNPDELPNNSMMLLVQMNDDGEMSILSGSNLDEDNDEKTIEFLNDVMTGLFLSFDNMINLFAYIGHMARTSEELYDELQGQGAHFEPDEELLKAIRDSKIIPFDKKKLN